MWEKSDVFQSETTMRAFLRTENERNFHQKKFRTNMFVFDVKIRKLIHLPKRKFNYKVFFGNRIHAYFNENFYKSEMILQSNMYQNFLNRTK